MCVCVWRGGGDLGVWWVGVCEAAGPRWPEGGRVGVCVCVCVCVIGCGCVGGCEGG